MIAVLGIDPTGRGTGAAVLRVDGKVRRWWAWTRVAAGWRLREGDVVDVFGSLAEVGRIVGRCGPSVVVMEGLEPSRVPGRRTAKATRDLIALAEGAGETLGGLRATGMLVEVRRPLASEWRAAAGLGSLAGDRAEDAAIAIARREGWLPRWTVAEQGALAEAALMARFGAAG